MLPAVHLSNGALRLPWDVAGFAAAGVLLAVGAWRVREDEVARIALLTAASFISSSIHIPLGPTSVHLLLNGLVGVLLGRRAGLAIFVGLLLQALLLNHGGYLELGANTCIITAPALLAWALYRSLHGVRWLRHPLGRTLLVGTAVVGWWLCTVGTGSLLWFHAAGMPLHEMGEPALHVVLHPATLAVALALAGGAAWVERRLENAPEFPQGLLVGELAVLATVLLLCVVLRLGGADFGETPPLVLAVLYLPLAAIEGVIVGFTVGFLARVKPELLGPRPAGPQSDPDSNCRSRETPRRA